MIYLSQLFLDPQSRQVQRELVSSYEMHRTLSQAFPNLDKDQFGAARVLFRVDEDKGAPYALVQSKVRPNWDAFRVHLGDNGYLLSTPRTREIDVDRLGLAVGQRLRFRLLANPTYRPFVAAAQRTKKNEERVGLYREHERLDWLLRRSQECGFALETHTVTLRAGVNKDGSRKPICLRGEKLEDELQVELPRVEVVDLNDGRRFLLPDRKNPTNRNQQKQFSAARFDGLLRITEMKAFSEALENGIGPAKGFGFGLFSLARA